MFLEAAAAKFALLVVAVVTVISLPVAVMTVQQNQEIRNQAAVVVPTPVTKVNCHEGEGASCKQYVCDNTCSSCGKAAGGCTTAGTCGGECNCNCRNVSSPPGENGSCGGGQYRSGIRQCDGDGNGQYTNCQDYCTAPPVTPSPKPSPTPSPTPGASPTPSDPTVGPCCVKSGSSVIYATTCKQSQRVTPSGSYSPSYQPVNPAACETDGVKKALNPATRTDCGLIYGYCDDADGCTCPSFCAYQSIAKTQYCRVNPIPFTTCEALPTQLDCSTFALSRGCVWKPKSATQPVDMCVSPALITPSPVASPKTSPNPSISPQYELACVNGRDANISKGSCSSIAGCVLGSCASQPIKQLSSCTEQCFIGQECKCPVGCVKPTTNTINNKSGNVALTCGGPAPIKCCVNGTTKDVLPSQCTSVGTYLGACGTCYLKSSSCAPISRSSCDEVNYFANQSTCRDKIFTSCENLSSQSECSTYSANGCIWKPKSPTQPVALCVSTALSVAPTGYEACCVNGMNSNVTVGKCGTSQLPNSFKGVCLPTCSQANPQCSDPNTVCGINTDGSLRCIPKDQNPILVTGINSSECTSANVGGSCRTGTSTALADDGVCAAITSTKNLYACIKTSQIKPYTRIGKGTEIPPGGYCFSTSDCYCKIGAEEIYVAYQSTCTATSMPEGIKLIDGANCDKASGECTCKDSACRCRKAGESSVIYQSQQCYDTKRDTVKPNDVCRENACNGTCEVREFQGSYYPFCNHVLPWEEDSYLISPGQICPPNARTCYCRNVAIPEGQKCRIVGTEQPLEAVCKQYCNGDPNCAQDGITIYCKKGKADGYTRFISDPDQAGDACVGTNVACQASQCEPVTQSAGNASGVCGIDNRKFCCKQNEVVEECRQYNQSTCSSNPSCEWSISYDMCLEKTLTTVYDTLPKLASCTAKCDSTQGCQCSAGCAQPAAASGFTCGGYSEEVTAGLQLWADRWRLAVAAVQKGLPEGPTAILYQIIDTASLGQFEWGQEGVQVYRQCVKDIETGKRDSKDNCAREAADAVGRGVSVVGQVVETVALGLDKLVREPLARISLLTESKVGDVVEIKGKFYEVAEVDGRKIFSVIDDETAARYVPKPSTPRTTAAGTYTATAEEIAAAKKVYRDSTRKLHPDTVAKESQLVKDAAKEQFQELQTLKEKFDSGRIDYDTYIAEQKILINEFEAKKAGIIPLSSKAEKVADAAVKTEVAEDVVTSVSDIVRAKDDIPVPGTSILVPVDQAQEIIRQVTVTALKPIEGVTQTVTIVRGGVTTTIEAIDKVIDAAIKAGAIQPVPPITIKVKTASGAIETVTVRPPRVPTVVDGKVILPSGQVITPVEILPKPIRDIVSPRVPEPDLPPTRTPNPAALPDTPEGQQLAKQIETTEDFIQKQDDYRKTAGFRQEPNAKVAEPICTISISDAGTSRVLGCTSLPAEISDPNVTFYSIDEGKVTVSDKEIDVVGKLGGGNFADVYEVNDDGQKLVLKVASSDMSPEKVAARLGVDPVDELTNQANTLVKYQSADGGVLAPTVSGVFVNGNGKVVAYVMEYIPGKDLFETGKYLPAESIANWLVDLQNARPGAGHGDLNLGNGLPIFASDVDLSLINLAEGETVPAEKVVIRAIDPASDEIIKLYDDIPDADKTVDVASKDVYTIMRFSLAGDYIPSINKVEFLEDLVAIELLSPEQAFKIDRAFVFEFGQGSSQKWTSTNTLENYIAHLEKVRDFRDQGRPVTSWDKEKGILDLSHNGNFIDILTCDDGIEGEWLGGDGEFDTIEIICDFK